MAELKVGSVVVLKSGSSVMTIEGFRNDGRKAVCVWSSEGGDIKRDTFPVEALQIHRPVDEQYEEDEFGQQ